MEDHPNKIESGQWYLDASINYSLTRTFDRTIPDRLFLRGEHTIFQSAFIIFNKSKLICTTLNPSIDILSLSMKSGKHSILL